MKLLIGGSPCTHWSIAQTKNRETEPEGLGWELFKNYLIALEKFKPDFFLYENNKSMAPAIRAQITRELGVEPILINSALVSAQNRQRLYWTNIPGVEQPEDLGDPVTGHSGKRPAAERKRVHAESQLCQRRGSQWRVRPAFPRAYGGGAGEYDGRRKSPLSAGYLLQGRDPKPGGKYCGL